MDKIAQHFVASVNNVLLLGGNKLLADNGWMKGKSKAPAKSAQIRQAFARRLKQARQAADFESAAELARRIGVEEETYRSWERGRTEPDITHLNAILTAVNVSADFLVAGKLPQLPKDAE